MPLSSDPEKRARQLANLNLYKSANHPRNGGRPKGSKNLRGLIQRIMDGCVYVGEEDEDGNWISKEVPTDVALIMSMINKAVNKNDVAAFKELMDRVHGKAIQPHILPSSFKDAIQQIESANKEDLEPDTPEDE